MRRVNGFLTKNNQKMNSSDFLKENHEAFSKMRSELYEKYGEGKLALIINKELRGVFDTYREALIEGYKITDKFNVQKITKEPELVTIATPFYMNENEQSLLTRAVQAETQASFLYNALLRIKTLSFGKEYEIASSACSAYEQQLKYKSNER